MTQLCESDHSEKERVKMCTVEEKTEGKGNKEDRR
jgi:hypothetical protein